MDDEKWLKGIKIKPEDASDTPWKDFPKSEIERLQGRVEVLDHANRKWEDHYEDSQNSMAIWRLVAVVEGIILAVQIIRKWL